MVKVKEIDSGSLQATMAVFNFRVEKKKKEKR